MNSKQLTTGQHLPPYLITGILIALFSATPSSEGALLITFEQDGADLVVEASGSVDLSGATFQTDTIASHRGIFGGDFDRVLNMSAGDEVYQIASSGFLFTGTFPQSLAANSTGDSFGLFADPDQALIYVPFGFTNGIISGSMRFESLDLADVSPIEQTISWGASSDQSVSIAIVPEPSTTLLFGTSLLLFVSRRKRISTPPLYTASD